MAFIIDKHELKSGLIIFRRADVQHRNWYCRIKIPDEDRYKTVSLETADIDAAKDRALTRTRMSGFGSNTMYQYSTALSARLPRSMRNFKSSARRPDRSRLTG